MWKLLGSIFYAIKDWTEFVITFLETFYYYSLLILFFNYKHLN